MGKTQNLIKINNVMAFGSGWTALGSINPMYIIKWLNESTVNNFCEHIYLNKLINDLQIGSEWQRLNGWAIIININLIRILIVVDDYVLLLSQSNWLSLPLCLEFTIFVIYIYIIEYPFLTICRLVVVSRFLMQVTRRVWLFPKSICSFFRRYAALVTFLSSTVSQMHQYFFFPVVYLRKSICWFFELSMVLTTFLSSTTSQMHQCFFFPVVYVPKSIWSFFRLYMTLVILHCSITSQKHQFSSVLLVSLPKFICWFFGSYMIWRHFL